MLLQLYNFIDEWFNLFDFFLITFVGWLPGMRKRDAQFAVINLSPDSPSFLSSTTPFLFFSAHDSELVIIIICWSTYILAFFFP